MIISNFKLVKENNWSKIQADVSWANNSETAYFAVPSEFTYELDISCADSFIIGLMLLAIKYDEDILVEGASVSKTLVENIYNILLPVLTKMGCGTGKTKIHGNFFEFDDQIRGKSGATGISMGVDSFYAILKNKENKLCPVNTVLYINQQSGHTLEIEPLVQEIFDIRKNVSEGLKLRFIPIITNLRYILDKEFIFNQYHAYCHLGAANTIKSISTYYYATGFAKHDMKLCFDDTAYYDDFISTALKHKNFAMKMSGSEVKRTEKTEFISNNKVVQENIDVCLKFEERDLREKLNCSKCAKCIRTLTTLEILGKISEFQYVFDLDIYYKNHNKIWGSIVYKKYVMKDVFAKEIINLAKKRGFKLPISRWGYFMLIGIENQINKLKKFIIR